VREQRLLAGDDLLEHTRAGRVGREDRLLGGGRAARGGGLVGGEEAEEVLGLLRARGCSGGRRAGIPGRDRRRRCSGAAPAAVTRAHLRVLLLREGGRGGVRAGV